MANLIIKALLKYLESNPDAIEQLVDALVKKLIEELREKTS
jgi:hypothetical protein